jgi:hypothetical protein
VPAIFFDERLHRSPPNIRLCPCSPQPDPISHLTRTQVTSLESPLTPLRCRRHPRLRPSPAASSAAGRRHSSARVFSLNFSPPRRCCPPVRAATANPSRAARLRRRGRVLAPPAASLQQLRLLTLSTTRSNLQYHGCSSPTPTTTSRFPRRPCPQSPSSRSSRNLGAARPSGCRCRSWCSRLVWLVLTSCSISYGW